MAALGIAAELRLVDRRECEVSVKVIVVVAVTARHRHALGGAQEIARLRRDDPLLAGQQRDLLLALHRNDSVIDLAGEQAEREADDTGRMAAHPLDRQVGLAGIRGSQDRPDRCV